MQYRFGVRKAVWCVMPLVVAVLLGPVVVRHRALYQLAQQRSAYARFIQTHPYHTRAGLSLKQLKAIPKKDRPDLAAELRFLQTVDPATGTIPPARLFEANLAVTEARRAFRAAAKNAETVALATWSWEERGPDNVGGRTRALVLDPNDPEGRAAWAGGVAGGLWYTADVTDPAQAWRPVADFWANIAVTAIAFDPARPGVLYVGTGEPFAEPSAVWATSF